MKFCTLCKTYKEDAAFGGNSENPDGLFKHCRCCRGKYWEAIKSTGYALTGAQCEEP